MMNNIKCFFNQTDEYFKEVVRSFDSQNYRSAVVMLYSTVICDILYKLRDLKEVYNDTVAAKILSDIETTRSETSGIEKSKWEWTLIERVYKETHLFDDSTYSDIDYLKRQRNLCAHPALNVDYDLMQPNSETVAAHMQNMYQGILSKPSVFIKSIIDHLTEDLRSKSDIFLADPVLFSRYLKTNYFEKMSDAMFRKVFKAFWKFSFISTDPTCLENIYINRELIVNMFKYNSSQIIKEISDNTSSFQVSSETIHKKSLLVFIAKCPEIITYIPEIVKSQAKSIRENTENEKLNSLIMTWFHYPNLDQFCVDILENIDKSPRLSVYKSVWLYLKDLCISKMRSDIYCNIAVAYVSASKSFDISDERISDAILQQLGMFSEHSLVKLISAICKNYQIHGRARATQDNGQIKACMDKLNPHFDYTPYLNFKYTNDVASSEFSE